MACHSKSLPAKQRLRNLISSCSLPRTQPAATRPDAIPAVIELTLTHAHCFKRRLLQKAWEVTALSISYILPRPTPPPPAPLKTCHLLTDPNMSQPIFATACLEQAAKPCMGGNLKGGQVGFLSQGGSFAASLWSDATHKLRHA